MSLGTQVTFGLYLAVLIAIGVYFFFRTDTKRLSDYLLAGRNVGTWPMAISDVASIASGWTFFAWVGVGFQIGISGLWFSITMIFIIVFMYRYVGPSFRRQSEQLNTITITDHLASVINDKQIAAMTRVIATAAMLVFMGSYIGAQVIATGEAMDTGIGIEYGTAILIGGIAVGIYTVLGGFNASIWTDVVQGVFIFFAAVTLPIVLISEAGGWSTFVSEAGAVDDAALLSMDAGLAGQALLLFVLGWVTFAFGTIGQPHSLMRFQAIRSERLLSPASVIAVTFQSLRLTVPLLIGAAGRVVYGEVGNPENVAMLAIVDFFPAIVAGLLLAAIVSAILSTSDSMLIVASSDFTRLYERLINPEASEKRLILIGRLTVGVFALFGIGLAWMEPGTIFDIIEFAYVGLGATFGLPLIGIIFWEKMTGEAVLVGVLAGLTTPIANLALDQVVAAELFPILMWPVCITAIIVTGLVTYDGESDIATIPRPSQAD